MVWSITRARSGEGTPKNERSDPGLQKVKPIPPPVRENFLLRI